MWQSFRLNRIVGFRRIFEQALDFTPSIHPPTTTPSSQVGCFAAALLRTLSIRRSILPMYPPKRNILVAALHFNALPYAENCRQSKTAATIAARPKPCIISYFIFSVVEYAPADNQRITPAGTAIHC